VQYDLSFWECPNWKREGSISPTFLALVGACLMAILAVAILSWSFLRLQGTRENLSRIQAQNSEAAAATAEIKRQQDCVRLWDKALAELDKEARSRITFCRQLAALQSIVPDDIVLGRLSVTSTEARVRKEKGGKDEGFVEVTELRYGLGISGSAYGDQAEQLITALSREMATHPELARELETVQLTSVTPLTRQRSDAPPGKAFSIIARFTPR
jgi:type II secretory pathway pseudopilin PulG